MLCFTFFQYWSCLGFLPVLLVHRSLATESKACTVREVSTLFWSLRKLSAADDVATAPILDVLDDDYQTWKFNGSFKNDSPYKGPPSPAVDKAWADLWDCVSNFPFQAVTQEKYPLANTSILHQRWCHPHHPFSSPANG